MIRPITSRGPLVGAMALLFVGAAAVAGPEARGGPPPNAVQKEMRLLEAAMQESVAAIAKGDVRLRPKLLHAVHTAGGDTSAALKSGAYKLPQRPNDVTGFLALDEAFHKEMITMVKAARKNDVATTATQFGKLMARCHGCHATYRFAPPAR
jgi:cytochrome c556